MLVLRSIALTSKARNKEPVKKLIAVPWLGISYRLNVLLAGVTIR